MNTPCLGTAERTCFEVLEQSSGLRFSRQVQHSWCARRAVNEGLLTLSVLRDEVRLSLLGAWMSSPDTLLDFMAERLPDPSAELSICRFEQLTRRAHAASRTFRAPDPALCIPSRLVQRGGGAGLTSFQDGPGLLVAPGLSSLCRIASPQEQQLWARLATPSTIASLIEAGASQETIQELLRIGGLDYAC
jgi:hypothetical protein